MRRLLVGVVVVALTLGWAAAVADNSGEDPVHACIGGDRVRIVADAGACKGSETHAALATEAAVAALTARIAELEAAVEMLQSGTVGIGGGPGPSTEDLDSGSAPVIAPPSERAEEILDNGR